MSESVWQLKRRQAKVEAEGKIGYVVGIEAYPSATRVRLAADRPANDWAEPKDTDRVLDWEATEIKVLDG